jgi:hypothetical protein
MTAPDIIAMCEAVDAGDLSVELEGGRTWEEAYGSGILTFLFGNGFRIEVFNGAGEWEYIESYIAPDGTKTVTDWLQIPLILNWEPKHFARWGITTGYLNQPRPDDEL